MYLIYLRRKILEIADLLLQIPEGGYEVPTQLVYNAETKTFAWKASGSSHFIMQVSDQPDFSNIVKDTGLVNINEFELTDRLVPASYYARVRNLDGAVQWSATFAFTVTQKVYPVPTELKQEGNLISWKDTGCGTYFGEIAEDEAFTKIVKSGEVTGNSSELPVLPVGTYYGRIRNTKPDTDWSETAIITIVSAGFPVPKVVVAASGADLTLSWEKTGANTNAVEIASDKDFNNILSSASVKDNNYLYTMRGTGFYYGRVRNEQPDTNWSEVVSYEYKA